MQYSILVMAVLVAMGSASSCANPDAAANSDRTATVILRDGTRLTGTVTENSAQQLKLTSTDGGSHVVPAAEVRMIQYDEAPAPAAAAPSPAPATATSANNSNRTARPASIFPKEVHVEHYHPPATAISSKTYLLPVGTQISVRTEDTIDSSTAVEGQTYTAEVVSDVLDNENNVVIPAGSNSLLVIKSASQGGRIAGASDLVLDVQSISIDGRRYVVDTTDLERRGRDGVGANKRTAVYTGTGAAIGAVIGAIAGGKKGAAIGAGAGAGAGAVTQTVTKGDAIKVPVETILTFQLDNALRVKAK